jgi:uncharacterized protein YPO0396
LREFPDIQTDLDPHVDSLDSFFALQAKISSDELPQHEARFKKRLNEKVLQEIGALRANLEQEREDIRDRIAQLNVALKLLEWKPGTFMQIETSDRKDQEILDFRRELTSCLQGSISDAKEVNEATFNRIKKICLTTMKTKMDMEKMMMTMQIQIPNYAVGFMGIEEGVEVAPYPKTKNPNISKSCPTMILLFRM